MEWLGFSHRATVNFGTLSQTAKPNKVTRSDVTKLPEMATSVYGGGQSSGHARNGLLFWVPA